MKYAVSPQRDGASIAIRAVANGASTRVELEDDGPGFDPDQECRGHGLALLRARLAMNFDEPGASRRAQPPGPDPRRHRRPVARRAPPLS